jgi:uncharacterized protein YbjT (DUF2867 family)
LRVNERRPTIAILGASGLIGHAVAISLQRDGFAVAAIARRFTETQKTDLAVAVESPVVGLEANALAALLSAQDADIVVNCVGVLQDGGGGRTDAVHREFVARLLEALAARPRPVLLVHLSIPGAPEDDQTAFSRTKRQAEHLIAEARLPFVILRPGFVIAPAAYGGSALIRALAALPIRLAAHEAARPFAVTDVADIGRTIAWIARRWGEGEHQWDAVWDVMTREATTVGGVVDAFRSRFGGAKATVPMPSWLMGLGARAGDLAAHLGWRPPIRSTALREMRRGVSGDPQPWIAATGIEPTPLDGALRRLPATVQESWFARLYLLKALIIVSLVVFWVVSGLIALTVAFDAATAVLTSRGFQPGLAKAVTVTSSLVDIAVGIGIAFRKTCRIGLLAGIGVSILYMVGAAVMTPDLWVEPLGALVKTGPAIVLMLVALEILKDR